MKKLKQFLFDPDYALGGTWGVPMLLLLMVVMVGLHVWAIIQINNN
jgi:hypothetical protein